ncbi:MAG: acetylxylan esterase [Armatimonadetes bacterium]|nr:acetylxylan esterase [Armatimonadota bacterium]
MKHSRVWALLALVLSVLAAPAVVVIDVDSDHADGIYRRGETAIFTVNVEQAPEPATPNAPPPKEGRTPLAEGSCSWTLSKDGVGSLGTGQQTLTGQPFRVEGRLDEPGILRLTVFMKVADKNVIGLGGAAYEPYELRPAAPAPDDFDAWWDEQKKLLAAVPMNPVLTASEKYSTDKIAVAQLTLANLNGTSVRGWFCRPKEPGKYPAILSVPGAGFSPTGPAVYLGGNWLSVNISVHDEPIDREPAWYQERYATGGALNGYPHFGRESRDSYYYRRVFLSFVRAIDFLTSQPDWDGRTMVVVGSSQGGGSALVAAGLDPRVTAASANVPAMCDHKGLLIGRTSGWPRLIPNPNASEVITTAGYYDAANFAGRIKCPVLVSVGLIDTTCPPTSVFAAFGAIPTTAKRMMVFPKMGHAMDPQFGRAQAEFLEAQRTAAAP